MAGVNYDTFERYQQKGLDARRAGQWDSARIYLLEAARAMLELSKQAQGQDLIEYGLLAALIAIVAIVGVTTVGNTIYTVFWSGIGQAL